MPGHDPTTPAPDPSPPVGGTAMLRDRADLDRAVEHILAALRGYGYPKASQFAVRLALEEAVSNALHHGHRAFPPGTPVRLEYAVTSRSVSLIVEDRGPGFDPDAVPDPTLDENLETPTGRGLMLMRAYMTRVRFNEAGNRVEMLYDRPPSRNGTSSDRAGG